MKVAIVTTHPIQYHAPLFAYLSEHNNYSLKVFYTIGISSTVEYDLDFGIYRSWNIDLLSGYDYEFLKNISSAPSSTAFFGVINPDLIKKLKAYNPDKILVFGWKHLSHLMVMRSFKAKKTIIFRGDSTTLDDDRKTPFENWVRYKILNWVYRHVDYVISPGKASDKYFQKSGVSLTKLVRVPHVIDNDRFSSINEEENIALERLKMRFGKKADDVFFLFAGKFYEKKNIALLIDAFLTLAKECNHVYLFLVGSGKLEASIREKIQSLETSVSKRIQLLPFQDQEQMKLIYRFADVFILPSLSETWGLSVNESLASGTPVVTSDKCGSSFDLVEEGLNGFVFQSDNSGDLYLKMRQCCNKDIRERLAKGTRMGIEKFSYRSFDQSLKLILN